MSPRRVGLLFLAACLVTNLPAYAAEAPRRARSEVRPEVSSQTAETKAPETMSDVLILGYGRIVETAPDPTSRGPALGERPDLALSQLVEQIEFLLTHGQTVTSLRELAALSPPAPAARVGRGDGPAGAGQGSGPLVVLTFDHPESFQRLVLPLLDLYEIPAVVAVTHEQLASAEVTLRGLAGAPRVELVPRVERPVAASPPPPCLAVDAVQAERRRLAAEAMLSDRLRRDRAALKALTGQAPRAVVWEPDAWDGAAEEVARGLGFALQVPTFEHPPPALHPPSVARYRVAPEDGIERLVWARAHSDPSTLPVRFAEVDAAWLCAAGEAEERTASVVRTVVALGLNGARLRAPGGAADAAVLEPLARALKQAGVRWVILDLTTASAVPLDPADASQLARAVPLDVALLPAGMEGGALGAAVREARPAAWIGTTVAGAGGGEFRLLDAGPGRPGSRGATLSGTGVGDLDETLLDHSARGWAWLGVAVEQLQALAPETPRELALPRQRSQTDGEEPPPTSDLTTPAEPGA